MDEFIFFNLFFLFFAGGIAGWIIDTSYRSIKLERFAPYGYLQQFAGCVVPFLPIYGIGLTFVYLIQQLFAGYGVLARVALYAMTLTLLELCGEYFVRFTIKIKLWDYSDNYLNYKGTIDLMHSIFWVLLALAAELIIQM